MKQRIKISKEGKLMLTRHIRLKLIETLQCGNNIFRIEQIKNLAAATKIPEDDIQLLMKFIENQAEKSNAKVEHYLKTEPFNTLNKWIKLLEEFKLEVDCLNELPIIFKLIAYTEDHPTVEEAGGIDFQLLYSHISNLMMGFPSSELNEPTKLLLESIVSEFLTENDGLSCDRLQNEINASTVLNKTTSEDDTNSDQYSILNDKSLNPLRITDSILN